MRGETSTARKRGGTAAVRSGRPKGKRGGRGRRTAPEARARRSIGRRYRSPEVPGSRIVKSAGAVEDLTMRLPGTTPLPRRPMRVYFSLKFSLWVIERPQRILLTKMTVNVTIMLYKQS